MHVVNRRRQTMLESPRKALMIEKSLFCLVGDDDSGPEDALDDLDLECVRALR
jgi:hypothetical protein